MLSKINNLKFWDDNKLPISLKLTLIYAVVFSLAILILSIVTFSISRYLGEQRIRKYIRDVSNQIVNYIEQGKTIDKNIFTAIDFKGPLNFKIYNQKGQLLLKSRPHLFKIDYKSNLNKMVSVENEELSGSDDRSNNSAREIKVQKKREKEDDIKILYLNKKASFQGQNFYVQVINLRHIRDGFFDILLVILIIINIVAILFSIVIGNYIAQKILQPIAEINQTAQSITINDLDKRIDTTGPNDELKELAITFNEMIDRLQHSINKQKQFIADASHELRTPVSVIQGYIDMLDRWGTEDEEVLAESIEAIQSETVGMKKMLEQLLDLARGDRADYQFDKEKFALQDLIEEVYQELELIADNKQLQLEQNDTALINADIEAVKQTLRIIIDNAMKYTREDGKIIISSSKKDTEVEIKVEDNGCGIPTEAEDKIFNRFYRVDESRTRETGGAGLGLAIAKWIVEDHGGEIKAQSEVGTGTTILVTLPLV
ncbi:MAG: ATP-binding protein [Bacillota bacterium]